MKHAIFLPLAFSLAACVTENIPLAPGDEGPKRSGLSLNLPQGLVSDAQRNGVSPISLTYEDPAIALLPEDEAKLRGLKETMAAALYDALPRGPRGRDAGISKEVLTAAPMPFGANGPVGTYRCRTLKHGGPAPVVAYSYFDCEINQAQDGTYAFRKTSGSQLMTGTLFPAPALGPNGRTGLAYAGTQHGQDEPALPYPDGQREVGVFERTGEDRYRLLIPEPGAEGRLDVIDLVRS